MPVCPGGERLPQMSLTTVDRVCRDPSQDGPGQGADEDVAGVVDPGVDARVGDQRGEALQRDRATGSTWPTPVAKAKAAAECPEGNEVETGILVCRASGTCSATRSGRRRPPSGFIPRFTTVAVTPTETRPLAAARRPRRPPKAARIAAAASDRSRVVGAAA